jgi:hypothetical protein
MNDELMTEIYNMIYSKDPDAFVDVPREQLEAIGGWVGLRKLMWDYDLIVSDIIRLRRSK